MTPSSSVSDHWWMIKFYLPRSLHELKYSVKITDFMSRKSHKSITCLKHLSTLSTPRIFNMNISSHRLLLHFISYLWLVWNACTTVWYLWNVALHNFALSVNNDTELGSMLTGVETCKHNSSDGHQPQPQTDLLQISALL